MTGGSPPKDAHGKLKAGGDRRTLTSSEQVNTFELQMTHSKVDSGATSELGSDDTPARFTSGRGNAFFSAVNYVSAKKQPCIDGPFTCRQQQAFSATLAGALPRRASLDILCVTHAGQQTDGMLIKDPADAKVGLLTPLANSKVRP